MTDENAPDGDGEEAPLDDEVSLSSLADIVAPELGPGERKVGEKSTRLFAKQAEESKHQWEAQTRDRYLQLVDSYLKGFRQDTKERKRYADRIFRLLCWSLAGLFVVILLSGLDRSESEAVFAIAQSVPAAPVFVAGLIAIAVSLLLSSPYHSVLAFENALPLREKKRDGDLTIRSKSDLLDQKLAGLGKVKKKKKRALLSQRRAEAKKRRMALLRRLKWSFGVSGVLLIALGFASSGMVTLNVSGFSVSDTVLIALISGTAAEIIAVFGLVAKYLFPERQDLDALSKLMNMVESRDSQTGSPVFGARTRHEATRYEADSEYDDAM